MKADAIFQPMLTLMGLTLVVWVYLYARRIPFITRNRLTPDQLTPAELARLSPPAVSNPSDNLKNLFELPTVFYALALYLYAVGQVDEAYVALAWVFVGFRVLHSAVHCTVNIVLLRFWLYAISAVALWSMVVRAAWRVLA
jgi:hypothetical protein